MKRKKAIPTSFNMSFGLLPVIFCMILSEFISDEYALYISSVLGLLYSFGSFHLSKKRIYNFVLYISTGILILLSLSTLLSANMFPKGTVPFTLEVMMFVLTAALFFGQDIFKKVFNKQKCPHCDDLICKSLDSSIVSARVISIMGVLHCIAIALFMSISYPLTQTENLILFQILPPLLLCLSIGINQIGIFYANRIMDDEEEIPIVNKDGNVIGRSFKIEAPTYKNNYINPIIRIAFISNGMLYLCSRKPDSVMDKNKTDIPLEAYLRFGETLEQGVERLVKEAYPQGDPIHPRFSIKHHFKTKDTNRLVYLYISYIEDESLLVNPHFKNGKLWRFQQIEQNLGKNYFGKCFEEEYEYLKETVKIWEEFK